MHQNQQNNRASNLNLYYRKKIEENTSLKGESVESCLNQVKRIECDCILLVDWRLLR